MNVFRVWLSGEVDVSRAGVVGCVVQDFEEARCMDAEVDLMAVSFMDSSGLTMLEGLAEVAQRRGGSVTLVEPPPSCLRLLEDARLASRFLVRERQRMVVPAAS